MIEINFNYKSLSAFMKYYPLVFKTRDEALTFNTIISNASAWYVIISRRKRTTNVVYAWKLIAKINDRWQNIYVIFIFLGKYSAKKHLNFNFWELNEWAFGDRSLKPVIDWKVGIEKKSINNTTQLKTLKMLIQSLWGNNIWLLF